MLLSKSICPQQVVSIWSHSEPKMKYTQHIVGIFQCSECVVGKNLTQCLKSTIVNVKYKVHSVGDITCYKFILTTFWPQPIDNGPQLIQKPIHC